MKMTDIVELQAARQRLREVFTNNEYRRCAELAKFTFIEPRIIFDDVTDNFVHIQGSATYKNRLKYYSCRFPIANLQSDLGAEQVINRCMKRIIQELIGDN